MEQNHPHLFGRVAGRSDPVSQVIRKQPDFIVEKGMGQPYSVEVKHRASGSLTLADIGGTGYPYPTGFIVLVSPYRIQCVTAIELIDGVALSRRDRPLLRGPRRVRVGALK